jgi:hypothetical protein
MSTLIGRAKCSESHARVTLCSRYRTMSKQFLYDANIGSVRNHVRGAAMPKGVRMQAAGRQSAESGSPQQHFINTVSS